MSNQLSFNTPKEDDGLSSFDFEKFLFILKKSIIWILVFIVVALSLAYISVRYTKPVYESSSVLKLDFESEATTLGLASSMKTFESELSGEIELLKSDLFFTKVVEAVGMDVSYHYYGRYLTDERYGNNPFKVEFKIIDDKYYDKPFDLEITSENEFSLWYSNDGIEVRGNYLFGQSIKGNGFELTIDKTRHFYYPEVKGGYFFTINSEASLINYFQRNVSVRPENFQARTIRISLTDFNKYKAHDLLQAIDTLYLEYTKQAKNQAVEQKIAFLDNQVRVTEGKIAGFEDYFEDFIIENRTLSLQTDLAASLSRLDMLDSARIRLKFRMTALETLDQQLSGKQEMIVSLIPDLPEAMYEYLKSYQEALNKRKEKLYSYNENTQVIKRIDNELEVLENTLSALVKEQKKQIANRITELNKQASDIEKKFVELPSMITDYDKTKRFYSLQENYLMSLWRSKMDLEIIRAGTVTNFVILTPASLPSAPVKPKPIMIYGIAGALGLVVSVMFLLIRYLMHTSISSLKELERLVNVPILGTVPEYSAEKLPLTKLIIKPSSKSAISEALRTMRTNMEFLHNAHSGTMAITITSTISGEGKTFIAVNLGAIIAFSNQKVCIVDLDMRKPKVHLAMGDEPSSVGMSTMLIGKSTIDECIRKTEVENLDYIPAGPNPPNPSELILNKEYDQILADLKSRYDLVILDTPPVGLVTDAVLNMKKSDIQLYVVRADYSKRSFTKSIENLYKINKFHHLTIIFNGVKANRKGYGYGHGYGYGYGYGYYDEAKK